MSRQEALAPETGARVPLQVQAQLRESIHALIVLADQRRIDLRLVAADGTETLTLAWTAADLRSAMDNLIENALRYTPEGGVVDVRLVHTPGRTVVEVVDTGSRHRTAVVRPSVRPLLPCARQRAGRQRTERPPRSAAA